MPGAAPVASLPMYDWPEISWANDALWAAIVARLAEAQIPAPRTLDRSHSHDAVWRDPALVLSQTCGYPFSTRLRGMVRLIGTPVYEATGCDGPYYSSMIVKRSGDSVGRLADLTTRRVAYNSRDSLSGYVVLRQALSDAGLDPEAVEWIETGSHRGSIHAVVDEAADVAAIDSVCWSLGGDYEAEAVSQLRVIDTTPLRPGLPFISAIERSDREIQTIRLAVSDAVADPVTREARQALHLTGMSVLDEWHYGPIARLAS
jgi:ABC-type phosphate/phosphonate transport system substrate-binding protein